MCCAKSLQSCPTLCEPKGCGPPGSSVHGILQARKLEWVAMPSSRGSSQARDQTCISLGLLRALYHERHLGSPDRPYNKPGRLHLSLQGSLSWKFWNPMGGRGGAGPCPPPRATPSFSPPLIPQPAPSAPKKSYGHCGCPSFVSETAIP